MQINKLTKGHRGVQIGIDSYLVVEFFAWIAHNVVHIKLREAARHAFNMHFQLAISNRADSSAANFSLICLSSAAHLSLFFSCRS